MINKMEEDSDGDEFPETMVITGFISTSFDRLQAESFAWKNDESGHERTLFKILWKE